MASPIAVPGLEPGIVRLIPYTPDWVVLFEREAVRIREALGSNLAAIEHIGSTAIPGMPAKPVIDIVAAVEKITDVDHGIAPMELLGYTYKGEYGIPGRHFFSKGLVTTHHVHMVEHTSKLWSSHLAFRDHLRTHAAAAEEYRQLKEHLVAQFANDRAAYTAAKAPFIAGILSEIQGMR